MLRFSLIFIFIFSMHIHSQNNSAEEAPTVDIFSSEEKTTSEQETNTEENSTTTENSLEENPTDEESQQQKISEMDELVVTPTRTEQSLFDAPSTAYVLTDKVLLREKAVRTVPEALREVPGAMIQKTAHGHGSPFFRGFTAFRNVFLIDGIRFNNSIFREGPNQYWNTVDYLTIKSLEVVKGPTSTLYGSDAIGATINLVTRKRERYSEESQINPRVYYRFDSAGRSSTVRTEFSGNYGENHGFLGGFYYKNFGDFEAGRDSDFLENTGYYEFGGDLKWNTFLSENAELTFAYFILDQNNVNRTHRTIHAVSFEGSTVGNEIRRRFDQERQLAYLRLDLFDLDSFFQEAQFTVSWQLHEEERDRIRADLRRDIQGIVVNTIGLQAQFGSENFLGKTIYGIEYYRDFVRSYRENFNADGEKLADSIQGPVGNDSNYDLLGIYLQHELPIGERLVIYPGVRYTHAWLDANAVEDPVSGEKIGLSDNWGQFTGNLRFLVKVDETANIFGGVSQGFRTPNLSDVTRLDSARSNEIETPVDDLDPEKFIQYEIGLKVNQERWYLQGSYYYTQIFDQIIRFPTGRIIDGDAEVTKSNEGDGFTHGVEVSAGFTPIDNWLVYGNFSWMEGIVSTFPTSDSEERDEPISRMQPAQGFVGVKWTHPTSKYWAEGYVLMARGQDRLSTRDKSDTQRIPPGGTPGYATFNLRGGAEIYEKVWVSAAVENIGNVDYRIHGSGQNEPGTNLILSLDAEF